MRQELFRFFKGSNALDYWDMWERVIAFFVVAGDGPSVRSFNVAILAEIEKVLFDGSALVTTKLQEDLRRHLSLCTEASVAVRKDGRTKNSGASMWRSSNLIRHHLVRVPLLNFTNFGGDFVSPKGESELELNSTKVRLSPRYVHFDECVNLVESGFVAIAEDDYNSLETADLVYSLFHGGENGEVKSEVIGAKAGI